jgi:putative transposase
MRRAFSEMYAHFVWGTWRRAPLLNGSFRERVYASICLHSAELGAQVVAVGGIEDHVHLLVRLPPTISASEFVGKVKGGSSWYATHRLGHEGAFKWQGAYGASSVSKRALPIVRTYVLEQEAHHLRGTLHPGLEREWE